MTVPSTREHVLREASELFARLGYAGTTTRAIAEAVGVRQPSLFYHFDSKAEMMNELLSHSLSAPAGVAAALAEMPGSPAARLCAYLRYDLEHLLRSPYNLAGLDSDEILALQEFSHWRTMQDVLRRARRRMIGEGIEQGEFVQIDVDLAQDAVTGLILGLIRGRTRHLAADAEFTAHQATDLALRALLADPRSLAQVRSDLTALPIMR